MLISKKDGTVLLIPKENKKNIIMQTSNKISSAVGTLGNAIGKGIIAGLAGTAAITIGQMIEMKITRRKPSDVPAKAVTKVLDIKPKNPQDKSKFNNEIHWVYGTLWGVARGMLSLMGVRKASASLAHFGAVWATELIMLPSLKVVPPVKKWGAGEVAKDAFHHIVYAVVAGLVFDAIDKKGLFAK